MALIIEDGTGVDGADSFTDVDACSAFALAYFGHSLTGSAVAKEAALRRAFAYMRSLDWVDNAFPTFGGTIPQAVKDAQHIFARAEFESMNALQPNVTAGQTKVLTGVDSLKWEVTGGGGVQAQRQTVLMALDRLKGLLVTGGGSVTWLDRA